MIKVHISIYKNVYFLYVNARFRISIIKYFPYFETKMTVET